MAQLRGSLAGGHQQDRQRYANCYKLYYSAMSP